MAIINDDLGQWNELGTITPNNVNWVKYDTPLEGTHYSLRVSFLYPPSAEINSYILLRMTVQAGVLITTTQAKRIYPQNEPVILDVQPPKILIATKKNTIERIEIKKYIYGGSYITPDYNYQVVVAEFLK